MGIYYRAIDLSNKEYIDPPGSFADKFPGIIHPSNPFSHMILMANVLGSSFDIYYDDCSTYESSCESDFKDMTDNYLKQYQEYFPDYDIEKAEWKDKLKE